MDNEQTGDDYIYKTASLIRAHELRLADAGYTRRAKRGTQPPAASYSVLSWIGLDAGAPAKPLVLSIDTHGLFYLLMRFEALGIAVGSLDVRVRAARRRASWISLASHKDKSDAVSISSFRSTFSAISKLSLGAAWFGRPPPPAPDAECKFIYSACTKLPAISLHPPVPGGKVISELAHDPPTDSAVPLDAFKNLQSLECVDIVPNTLLGWDLIAESLRSLTIRRSGVEDFTDVLVDAVVRDQLRREGKPATGCRPKLMEGRARTLRAKQGSLLATMPSAIQEDVEEPPPPADTTPPPALSPLKWAFLRHLCLADNAITFFPSAPLVHLTALTHLDLSSNLLVSVPSGLGALHNLLSLNLSDNMIDSVLGISTTLGAVVSLNLAHNRLELLAGLERLTALERLDLRDNAIEESAEVGRLAPLPCISHLSVAGNPFASAEPEHRVRCLAAFAREGRSIVLDDAPASFYERRQLPSPAPAAARVAPAPSPTVVAVTSPTPSPRAAPVGSPPAPTPDSPPTSPVPSHAALHPKARRRKNMRIVDLDGGEHSGTDDGASAKVPPRAHRGRHARAATVSGDDVLPDLAGPLRAAPMTISRHARRGTEMGSTSPGTGTSPMRKASLGSGSATVAAHARPPRARLSAAAFEPPPAPAASDAEAFRAKIDALRSEVGDSWLKVLGQSQFGNGTPRVSPGTSPVGHAAPPPQAT